MFPNSKIGGDIHQGDIIAIADNNDFSLGIYFGRGRGGTVQYYAITVPKYCFDRHNALSEEVRQRRGPFQLNHMWKCYINSPRETRVMKLNRDNITDPKNITDLQAAKEILAQFNITVNF